MSVDIRLIAILDPPSLGDRALAAAAAAEAGGATMLQVRMKNSPASEMLQWTERLVEALAIPVWVNDRADVAWAARAAGVHVGADDIPVPRLRHAAPVTCSIGVSVGNEREAAAALTGDPDYWSIGAIYQTGMKPDAGAPIGPEGLSALAARAPKGMPIVAIGGITAERVPEVVASGAGGVAVISAIFLEPDPEKSARGLRDAVDASLDC